MADLVERYGIIVRHWKNAVLFFDDESASEIWVPYKLRGMEFVVNGQPGLTDIEQTEPDDEVAFYFPRWFVDKEGLTE